MWFLIITLFPNTGPLGIFTGHSVALALYIFLFLRLNLKIADVLRPIIFLTIFFSASVILSLLANHDQLHVNLGLLRYGLVPFYWLFGLVCGIVDTYLFSKRREDFFFNVAVAFLIFQLPVVLMQLFGVDAVVNNLWIAEKARDWTQIVRVVGTVQNPNTLGVLTIFCIIIFADNLKRKPNWSRAFIVVSFLIIMATGSRTSLVIALFLPFLFISKEQFFSKKSFYILISSIITIIAFYFLLQALREELPYMSQILDLVKGGSVHTLETRLLHWENVNELYTSSSLIHKLFGLGPRFFAVLDNSYLYVLFNYGILSLLVFSIVILELLRIFSKVKNKIGLRCFVVLIISGLVTDLMVSFLFMTVIFYFLGLEITTRKSNLKLAYDQ